MSTMIIGMRAAGTGGTENAAATVDVPSDATLTGVDWDGYAHLDGDDEAIIVELSFIATNQTGSNDVRGRISSVSEKVTLTTSGMPVSNLNKFVGPMEMPVMGGERLYLHIVATAGVTSDVRCNLHLDTTRPQRRFARRRDVS